MDKLVVDIDKIISNLKKLSNEVTPLESSANSLKSANISCSIDEVTKALEPYVNQAVKSVNQAVKKTDTYTNKVDECCSEYQKNEEDIQTISVDALNDVIINNPDVTYEYKGNAANKLTGLKTTKIKVPLTDEMLYLIKDGRAEYSKDNLVNKALMWALKTADNESIGYNQVGHWGENGYDCATLIITAYKNAGINLNKNTTFYCPNMKSGFLNTGKFEWIPGNPKVEDLKPGDILLDEDAHTEMYIGNGKNVGAHSNYDGGRGDSSGEEVDVGNYYSHPWDGVLRYKGEEKNE